MVQTIRAPHPANRRATEARTLAKGLEPCFNCGKPVADDSPVVETHLGDVIVAGEPDISDPGYTGCFPVGPDCKRRIDALAKEATA